MTSSTAIMDDSVEIGTSTTSICKLLESQKELFHSQIDQLQRVVVTQCKLTGVNPLSQEMAAGALSIKIGKRPRDLMNPKAVKYMQAVFSIKDAISKKESRGISAQFGVTVAQVREFFNGQRSRVRKLAHLSREKITKVNAIKGSHDEIAMSSNPATPIKMLPLNSSGPDSVPFGSADVNPVPLTSIDNNLVPLNSVEYYPVPLNSISPSPVPLNSVGPNPVPLNVISPSPVPLSSTGLECFPFNSKDSDQVPLNSIAPVGVEEAPFYLSQDDVLSGLSDSDKHFVQNIFSSLRKEETFSGQVRLIEWILQIQNPSVLDWFLDKGGVMILTTWLTQAAAEEQTTVIHVMLKVFCHLPLDKAIPEHMSAILHSVNGLRFYRTSDISNRARVLLSRWSKMFARRQALKKPSGSKSSTDPQEMILKRSIDEIMGDELWHPDMSGSDGTLTLALDGSENSRKLESSQPLKLLPASTEDSSRKNVPGVSSSHGKGRRKVKLVEQPDQRKADKSQQTAKSEPVSQSRPMSADDIQKAKQRALYMQNKHGGKGSISNGSMINKPSPSRTSLPNHLSAASKVPLWPMIEKHKKPVILPQNVSSGAEGRVDTKPRMDQKDPTKDLLSEVQIRWQKPPETTLDDLWSVGAGENSKEINVQKNRNRREMEIIYRTIKDVPPNPREPWDLEMDYDDSLTPEIPIEQPPEADDAEMQVSNAEHVRAVVAAAPSLPQIGVGGATAPDLELLAILLKNPELVFALTSGQGVGNLSGEDTVKLLDMIKSNAVGSASTSDSHGGKVEVSLPSPTPSSNPRTGRWGSEEATNPFTRQVSVGNRVTNAESTIPASVLSAKENTSSLRPHNQTHIIKAPLQQASVLLPDQQVKIAALPYSLQRASNIQQNQQPTLLHLTIASNSSPVHMHPLPNIPIRDEHFMLAEKNRASPISSLNVTARHGSFPIQHSLAAPSQAHTPSLTQTQLQRQPMLLTEHHEYSRQASENVGTIPESWRARHQLPNPISQGNRNDYGHPLQPQSRPHLSWERNENRGSQGFESWSPENSPSRSQEYMPGRNNSGPNRLSSNPAWDYNMPDSRPGQRDQFGYPEHMRNANRRWR